MERWRGVGWLGWIFLHLPSALCVWYALDRLLNRVATIQLVVLVDDSVH